MNVTKTCDNLAKYIVLLIVLYTGIVWLFRPTLIFTMWLYHFLAFLRNLNIFVHLQVSKFAFGQKIFYHGNTLQPNFLIVEPPLKPEWKCCTSYTVDSCKITSILPNRIYFKAINWEENQTSACSLHCVMILSSVYALLGQPCVKHPNFFLLKTFNCKIKKCPFGKTLTTVMVAKHIARIGLIFFTNVCLYSRF